jgi:hypothetical protein
MKIVKYKVATLYNLQRKQSYFLPISIITPLMSVYKSIKNKKPQILYISISNNKYKKSNETLILVTLILK